MAPSAGTVTVTVPLTYSLGGLWAISPGNRKQCCAAVTVTHICHLRTEPHFHEVVPWVASRESRVASVRVQDKFCALPTTTLLSTLTLASPLKRRWPFNKLHFTGFGRGVGRAGRVYAIALAPGFELRLACSTVASWLAILKRFGLINCR